ncbi:unnamed protein product [Sphagnum jensenii]|uniref:Uncharacterized protein n=1 Tax=Sphagnum jensenii TaxID=128206 RepID=A0ABP1B880_9BRYO
MADTRRAREMVVGQIHHHHKEQQQQQRQQHRRGYSLSSARREKDEDLALFQDMRKCEHTQYLLSDLEDAAKLGDLFDPIAAACIERKGVGADLLNSDADKNDYDWLLTPPGTPLFPSLDLESHAYTPLQQGLLMNHSLAAIKTSRIASNNHAEGLVLKSLVRGNQNPIQRPGSSTPLSTQSNSTPRSTPTTTASGTPHSVKPSTPTKSSTSSASKFSLRVASSTPAQQSPSITSSFTGRASTAYSNRPSTPTNRPSTPTGRPSTPTLRRSSSSSTSTRAFSTVTARGNPSPTRSTASSGASRGISPVRSQYKGNSPARGRSPVPAMERGSSSSPRIHSVIIPDGLPSDIPPNLRTTSDRAPSSAHHQYAGYSEATTTQMPDILDHTSNQPVSPNFVRSRKSTSNGQDRSSVQSGRVSSDDDSSSYEVSSQSAVSSRGLTPERGRGYAQQPQPSLGNEDWRKSHSSFQAKQSPSSRDSPHFGTILTRKTPNAVSRNLEIHRSSSSGGFRPLMTKNSISTLYNNSSSSSSSSSNSTAAAAAAAATTRANTFPHRPLTPGSTASSEQGAASVAPDSDGDEDLLNAWGQLELSSLGGGRHADILVLDKEHEKLTSWESLQQYEQDLKLPESTIVHSDMHDEADSYKSHGFSGTREALVVEEEEESSLHSVSSLSVRELKLRSMLDEESNSECMGATTEWLCLDLVAKKGTDIKVHEKGRRQLEHKQQVLNLQAKEDNIAVLPEFLCNSELDLHKELDTERGRRALSFSSSLLKDESCGSENEVAIGKEMESSGSHPEKDAGIAMDLMHVREKLILLCCSNPNLEPPDLQQCSEQDKKLSEKPQAGNIVVEQSSVPSLPFQELCMSSEHESNNDVAATKEQEVETGSNTEAAANTEIMCVCNHAKHPGKHCESPGCECITGHAVASAPSAPKMELQSLTHDESVESEAVKSAILGSEAQNALDMARQKNIWYMYRNSEDYVSSLCDNTETTELETVSSQGGGGGGFSSEIEKEVQTAAVSHHMNTSSSGIMQVLELSNHQQGVEDEASNHEQQSKDPLNLFTIGLEESLTSIQMELESQRQQEKEEDLQNGLVEQDDKSVDTTTACNDPHAKCMELLLPQLLNHVSERVASGVCWQELTKPGSDVLCSRSVHDDSEVDILSSVLSDQELDPNLESMLRENQKLKDRRTVQEVMAQLAMEDVLKQDDDDETSMSSEELEHEREDPGDGLLLGPLIAKVPNVEMVECSESRVTIEATENSDFQPALRSRQDGIKSPGDHQDLKHISPDPQGLIGSTQQTAGPDPQALIASSLQTVGPDPQALVASSLQTVGPDPQALVASALQTAGPDPQALVASALQTAGPDPQVLVASILQTAGPDPHGLAASTQETDGPDPQALIFSILQTAGPDPQALIASTQQTASPDPQALVACTLQTAGPDPQALVAFTLQTAGPDPQALVASTLQTVGLDPQALVASTLQTVGLDPQALVASALQIVGPDPQALVVSALQIVGPDPQAFVASAPQIVHANQVADVIRSGEDVEHDQANVYSDQKGLEQKGLEHIRDSEAAALETKTGDACSHRDEAQNIEQGMMIASVEELHFLDILEDGGCTSLSHPGSSDASIQQSSVSGTTDDADVNMPAEDPKQVQCSKTSDLWNSPQMMMRSPVVESEEPISANLALPVMVAATECVPEFDEVVKDLTQHTEGQGRKPVVGSVPFVVNDNNNSLTLIKPVVKLHENSIGDAVVEKLVVDIVDVGVKGFDDESKEVISCDAQKPGAEEGNKQSLCVEKKPYALHLTSLHSKAFEAPYGGLRGRVTARLQATLSKSESSKSSGSFLASSLDVSQSTDTISSCPSNSSWEDPQYCLSSGFWEMMKSSPTNAHVSDDVLDLPFPMELQKQGTGIKQGKDDVTKSSPSCDQLALVRFGSVRASQPEDEDIIKQQTPSEENCLDYYSVDEALLGGSKTTSAAGLWQIVENLKTLSDSETKKKDEMMTETDSRTVSARTSNQTLASEKIVVEHGMLVHPTAVENMHALDSVAALDGKMVTLPNMVVSPVKDEIVENSESPGPNSRKHLSSFKFGRTSTIAEPERKDMLNMSLEVFTDDNLKQEVPLTGKLPGKSQTMTPGRKEMDALNGMQLSKVNMMVTDGKSSMQEVQSGDSSQPVQLTQWSTNGIRRMAEELNGQSRFSNSTVHPGSVSEYFELERSSLDEVSCSSSSGSKRTVAASGMVSQNISLAEVTDRILFCSSIVHDLVYEAAELASKKEKKSRTTASSSADLKTFSPNAGSLSGQEKYCEHDNNQNGHAQEESTNAGNEKYHEHDNMHGHAQEEGNSLGSGTTMTARHSLTYPPNEGFEMPPGSRKSMSSPQVQVMCIRSKEAESMVKEDVIMHPTETVRLNHEVNFNAKKTNDKCRCVIL